MNTETPAIVSPDGLRDLIHLDRALRTYRAARSEMACSRRPVVLFDSVSRRTLELGTMNDVRMLLFAAAAAYRGARSEGLTDAAEIVLAEIHQEIRRVERSRISN
jgi:hypothetical protein